MEKNEKQEFVNIEKGNRQFINAHTHNCGGASGLLCIVDFMQDWLIAKLGSLKIYSWFPSLAWLMTRL